MSEQRKSVNLPADLQEQLVKISGTSYSISGYPPVASEWKLTPDEVCEIIKRHTSVMLKDVSDVTLDINHKTGAIYAYIWLPKNSKNICDNELNSGNSAINRTMTKFSPALKEYMDKFCDKDKKRIFSEEKNLPVAGIEVRIEAFMKIEFDENGYQFGKTFGDSYKRKTSIELTGNFSKGDDGRFGKLLYLQVKKFVRDRLRTSAPKPKRSFNAR